MQLLKDRIRKDGKIKSGDVLKVDSFLNHQMDIKLFEEIGKEFKRRFADSEVNKILTIEASGIGIACICLLYTSFVQEVSEYKTVDEYKESIRQSILDQKEEQAKVQMEDELIKTVLDNCQIETKQEAIDANYNNYVANYTNQAAAYGIDLNTFTSAFFGMDIDTFKAQLQIMAESAVEQRLAFPAIAEKEGITITDADRDAFAKEMGYESKDQLIETCLLYTSRCV